MQYKSFVRRDRLLPVRTSDDEAVVPWYVIVLAIFVATRLGEGRKLAELGETFGELDSLMKLRTILGL